MSERVFSPWTWIYALVKRVPDTHRCRIPRLSLLVVFPEMKRKRVHDVHPTVLLPREIVILTFPLPLCTRSSVPIPRLVLILLLLCAIFCAFPPPLTRLISLHVPCAYSLVNVRETLCLLPRVNVNDSYIIILYR